MEFKSLFSINKEIKELFSETDWRKVLHISTPRLLKYLESATYDYESAVDYFASTADRKPLQAVIYNPKMPNEATDKYLKTKDFRKILVFPTNFILKYLGTATYDYESAVDEFKEEGKHVYLSKVFQNPNVPKELVESNMDVLEVQIGIIAKVLEDAGFTDLSDSSVLNCLMDEMSILREPSSGLTLQISSTYDEDSKLHIYYEYLTKEDVWDYLTSSKSLFIDYFDVQYDILDKFPEGWEFGDEIVVDKDVEGQTYFEWGGYESDLETFKRNYDLIKDDNLAYAISVIEGHTGVFSSHNYFVLPEDYDDFNKWIKRVV